MGRLVLREEDLEAMRGHVRADSPLEACGLVAGMQDRSTQVFKIHNEEASRTRFRMDAKQQYLAFVTMERNGWDLLAIYHSHPSGPADPSRTDLAEAMYPGVAHLIWSPQPDGWKCKAFFLDDGMITPAELEVDKEQLFD
jgi:proteasome lid subunit RPN8/RPN11